MIGPNQKPPFTTGVFDLVGRHPAADRRIFRELTHHVIKPILTLTWQWLPGRAVWRTVLVKEVYLATLCRVPSETESGKAVDYISKADSQVEGAQDLLWALINSPSFLFNR